MALLGLGVACYVLPMLLILVGFLWLWLGQKLFAVVFGGG